MVSVGENAVHVGQKPNHAGGQVARAVFRQGPGDRYPSRSNGANRP
jgi:hypothetical protein